MNDGRAVNSTGVPLYPARLLTLQKNHATNGGLTPPSIS